MIAKSVLLLLLNEASNTASSSLSKMALLSSVAAMDITDETSGEKLYQAPDTVKDVVKEEHQSTDSRQGRQESSGSNEDAG